MGHQNSDHSSVKVPREQDEKGKVVSFFAEDYTRYTTYNALEVPMGYIITRVIYVVFALVELILGLRLILKLFGANATNPFVSWAYETSAAVLDPFRGIFPTTIFQSTFVIEFSTIFAMVIYAIIAMLLIYLVEFITRPIDNAIADDTVVEKKVIRRK